MESYGSLLNRFVAGSRDILKADLVGVYLHGSAVMGCFNEKKSDLDLVVVVERESSDAQKRTFMDMVVTLNEQAPAKGIELSVVERRVCVPFVYPTPFVLHFSVTHLGWYRSDPEGYVRNMRGNDPDLAAHFTILWHRGRTLWGRSIGEIFGPVPEADYMDSIWRDIENAVEDILNDPVYVVLNLCRVLGFRRERLVLSKREGGQWGFTQLENVRFRELIRDALRAYETGEAMTPDRALAAEFAAYMLGQIR